MTKRFKYHLGFICEKRDGEYYSFTIREVCDLLNDLSDENEQLKHDATVLIQANQDYRRENEQLKQKNKGLQSELHIFKEDVIHSNKIIDKLNDENEQLKSELKSLRKKYNDFSDAVDKRLKELIK